MYLSDLESFVTLMADTAESSTFNFKAGVVVAETRTIPIEGERCRTSMKRFYLIPIGEATQSMCDFMEKTVADDHIRILAGEKPIEVGWEASPICYHHFTTKESPLDAHEQSILFAIVGGTRQQNETILDIVGQIQ